MAEDSFGLCLLSSVLYLTLAINVDIPNPTYEFVQGHDATIPCKFTPAKQPVTTQVIVTWSAHADLSTDPDIAILTGYLTVPQTIDVDSDYEGKASLDYDIASGKANLQLTSLTSKESRVFVCKVTIQGDKTGKNADTTNVVVWVAPSKPKCSIQGKAEIGQNISLTCHSDEGTPTPAYGWQSYDVRNVLRPNPPKSSVDASSGVMSLYNISADTSGYFICTSSNKIRQQTCNLTLVVMPPSMNIASTAGIIGACVAGLLLLLVIIYCCCCCKEEDKEEYTTMAFAWKDVHPPRLRI